MSSSSGTVEVREIPCDPPGGRDANWTVLFSVDPPRPVVMALRDHAPMGSIAAFFRESISRDAMTGMKIVFVLSATS